MTLAEHVFPGSSVVALDRHVPDTPATVRVLIEQVTHVQVDLILAYPTSLGSSSGDPRIDPARPWRPTIQGDHAPVGSHADPPADATAGDRVERVRDMDMVVTCDRGLGQDGDVETMLGRGQQKGLLDLQELFQRAAVERTV